MEKSYLQLILDSAVSKSNGGMTWHDVISTIEQIRRAKAREQLTSALSDLSIADLTVALEVAVKNVPPALPTVTVTPNNHKKR